MSCRAAAGPCIALLACLASHVANAQTGAGAPGGNPAVRPASSLRPTELGTPPTQQPSGESVQAEHPLTPAVRMAEAAVQAAAAIPTYEATLYRKVWIDRAFNESTARIKYRAKPKSVYLYFEQPNIGREVLWIEGYNNGKMLAHEGSGALSLLGTISLDPLSPQAMAGSKNPITKSGLAEMGQAVVSQWKEEMKYGEVEVKLFPEAKLDDIPCQVIETTHPQPRREFKFHKTRLFLTLDTNVPFAVQQLGWPQQPGAKPPILEDYRYRNLKLNAGLTAADFDPRNPAYNF